MLVVNERITIPDAEFTVDTARSGGPGGQNVNKVESKVVVRWRPAESASLPPAVRARLLARLAGKLTGEGDLIVTSQRTRDQGRNRDDAFDKIRQLVLAAATPPKVRRATKPTRASQVRRVEDKARRSARKQDRRTPDHD
jgi:ribosome-associated protein